MFKEISNTCQRNDKNVERISKVSKKLQKCKKCQKMSKTYHTCPGNITKKVKTFKKAVQEIPNKLKKFEISVIN